MTEVVETRVPETSKPTANTKTEIVASTSTGRQTEPETSSDEIKQGDYVMTKVDGRGRELLFLARVDVIDDDDGSYEGVFLKRVNSKLHFTNSGSFIVDENDGGSWVKEDLLLKLPTPKFLKGSARKSNQLVFDIDLHQWNLG
jgi:hypothetical protein